MTAQDLRRALTDLKATLEEITQRDQEQEVRGLAINPLDALIGEARRAVGDHPVVNAVRDVINIDDLASGDPPRAIDVLIVVRLLLSALPEAPRVGPKTFRTR